MPTKPSVLLSAGKVVRHAGPIGHFVPLGVSDRTAKPELVGSGWLIVK